MKRNAKTWAHLKKVYDKIWKERRIDGVPCCEFCGKQIGSWNMYSGEWEWAPINFQHTVRGRGKGVWDNPDCLKLICQPCHSWQDHKERTIYPSKNASSNATFQPPSDKKGNIQRKAIFSIPSPSRHI